MSAFIEDMVAKIANVEWTRLNQLRAAWGITISMTTALVISAIVATTEVTTKTLQFSLIWYIITVVVWATFSFIVLLVNVPWIQIDPSIGFGALVASTAFLLTVEIEHCVFWASFSGIGSATSVAVFSALSAGSVFVTLVGFLRFKDDLVGDTGTMEAPNVVAMPAQKHVKPKDYYGNHNAEQA